MLAAGLELLLDVSSFVIQVVQVARGQVLDPKVDERLVAGRPGANIALVNLLIRIVCGWKCQIYTRHVNAIDGR